MKFACECGQLLGNTASPIGLECIFLDDFAKEKMQDLVDEEVAKDGSVDMWREHWRETATVVWKCFKCQRLYFNMKNGGEITVYKVEKTIQPT
jgi:hypothetical protein